MDSNNDVQFVAPVALPFADGDLQLMVGPANMGQIARMAQLVRPVVGEVMAMPADTVARLIAHQPNETDMAWLFELLCDRASIAAEMMSIATGVEVARINALLPDRFTYLFVLVYEANADFFSRAASMFKAAWARLEQATQAAEERLGPKPSTA